PTEQANGPSNVSSTPSVPSGAPTMENLRVEFRTATEPISLSATSDGSSSIETVTPGTPRIFEPRQSLKLSYAKSLASSAQLFINGRQITLPSQPANPKRIPIEIEISSANLAEIWNAGSITFGPAATPVSREATPQPTATETSTPATGSPSPRPATPSPTVRITPAATSSPRPTQTPIIVGGNRNATPRRTPN